MRKIKYIAVHCTAGNQSQTIEDLRAEFYRKGWKNPGYHYVIKPDGGIVQMHPEEKTSNGVKGYNSVSLMPKAKEQTTVLMHRRSRWPAF